MTITSRYGYRPGPLAVFVPAGPHPRDHRERGTGGTTVQCCGTQGQVIEVRGGEEPLAMVRCTT